MKYILILCWRSCDVSNRVAIQVRRESIFKRVRVAAHTDNRPKVESHTHSRTQKFSFFFFKFSTFLRRPKKRVRVRWAADDCARTRVNTINQNAERVTRAIISIPPHPFHRYTADDRTGFFFIFFLYYHEDNCFGVLCARAQCSRAFNPIIPQVIWTICFAYIHTYVQTYTYR